MYSVKDRFLGYLKIDTQSDPSSLSTPSTSGQMEFQKMLKAELEQIGLEDVLLTEKGYLYATIPATVVGKLPVIGFIAHVDTSPDFKGSDIKPQIFEYKGGNIMLNKELGLVTSITEFPELKNYIGNTLITTDGTTLLGSDDKAGVAEIVSAAEYLVSHPEIKHGKIRIAFTPDEEIGRGADHFDVSIFGADFAYTMDGSSLGELEYENFNAASAVVKINGRNVHPGYAKDKMKNAFSIGIEFDSLIPKKEKPEYTEGYQGFYHLTNISGSVDSALFTYIIRDHSNEDFDIRKRTMSNIASSLNSKYGTSTVDLVITDQYKNMRSVIENGNMRVVELAKRSMTRIGITPKIKAIRGGTDGSRLSFMGLPCPNLFAGGENFHGKHEFVSVEVMNKAVELIIEIATVNNEA